MKKIANVSDCENGLAGKTTYPKERFHLGVAFDIHAVQVHYGEFFYFIRVFVHMQVRSAINVSKAVLSS